MSKTVKIKLIGFCILVAGAVGAYFIHKSGITEETRPIFWGSIGVGALGFFMLLGVNGTKALYSALQKDGSDSPRLT